MLVISIVSNSLTLRSDQLDTATELDTSPGWCHCPVWLFLGPDTWFSHFSTLQYLEILGTVLLLKVSLLHSVHTNSQQISAVPWPSENKNLIAER